MNFVDLAKLSYSIDFLAQHISLLDECAENGMLPDDDTIALMGTTIEEVNQHWNKFIKDFGLENKVRTLDVEGEAEDAARRTLFESDKISKVLMYARDEYVPVIYKHEWEFNSKAYWAMYAKRTANGFSNKKVLFVVSGTTLANVLYKFYKLYDRYSVDKFIVGKKWCGPEPFSVDFFNDECNVGVTSVTQK